MIGDSTSERATIARIVTNNMIQEGYSQLNNIENVSHNVLDLIYSNEPELTLVEPAISRLIAKELSDPAHHPLSITLESESMSYQADKQQQQSYCFRKANYEAIKEELASLDYEAVFSGSADVNDMLNKFYDSLYGIIDKHVPKASLRVNNHPPWFNKELINLKNLLNRKYKKLCSERKENPDADDSKFEQVTKEFEIAHKTAHEAYIKDLGENFKSNPKDFWSHHV